MKGRLTPLPSIRKEVAAQSNSFVENNFFVESSTNTLVLVRLVGPNLFTKPDLDSKCPCGGSPSYSLQQDPH